MNEHSTAPQRVLIAPDKFKGTLTAKQAAAALRRGFERAWPHAQFTTLPLADGGEGFTECWVDARQGRLHTVRTADALGRPCDASWGEVSADVAAVDIASASGLAQLAPPERNPRRASTFGTGLVLQEILRRGFREVVVGLGGTATTDGGIGIAAALGFRFLDAGGRSVELSGAGLASIARIESPQTPVAARFTVATDVDNPLYGLDGAAHRFAGQKGADADVIDELDAGLRHFASVVREHVGADFAAHPGAGAAGGVGFGMMALLGAQRRSGFDVLRDDLQLDALIAAHDLIVTGEGCFDATSLGGKAPARVAQLSRERGVAVWGVFGRTELADVARYFERHSSLARGEPPPADVVTNQERLSLAAFEMAEKEKPR